MGSTRQGGQHSSGMLGVWHQPDLLSISSQAVFREERDRRLIDSSDCEPAQLRIRPVLPAPAYVKGYGRNHMRVYRDLLGAGAEPAHQAEEAPGTREARAAVRTGALD
jgi:hypothetical protein